MPVYLGHVEQGELYSIEPTKQVYIASVEPGELYLEPDASAPANPQIQPISYPQIPPIPIPPSISDSPSSGVPTSPPLVGSILDKGAS